MTVSLETIICLQKAVVNKTIFNKEKCDYCNGKKTECGFYKPDTTLVFERYYQQKRGI